MIIDNKTIKLSDDCHDDDVSRIRSRAIWNYCEEREREREASLSQVEDARFGPRSFFRSGLTLNPSHVYRVKGFITLVE